MNPLEARRRILGRNVYKRTTEGNPAIAQGSLARMYPGITMQGWTEQNSTTGSQLFNVDSMKQVTLPSGERWGYEINIPAGSYTLSTTNPNNITGTGVYLYLRILGKDGEWSSTTYVIVNQSPKKNIPITLEEGDIIYFYDEQGVGTNEISKQKFQQMDYMLNTGSSALSYEPYTGGQPSPSPDYPQPITSAGKYNEDTQKWEYEITIANEQSDPDKNQTVTLTADRPLTKWDRLEKRDRQWGWAYKSDEYIFDSNAEKIYVGVSAIGNEVNSFYAELPNKKAGGVDVFSNKFKYDYGAWNAEGHLYGFSGHPISALTYFKVSKDIDTSEAFKIWMIENQVSVWYETAEETFVPLSTSEQEQMNALYTFRPTTVLSNDCECNMTLTYKTKKSLEVAT